MDVVSELLVGKNYRMWEFEMLSILEARNLREHVEQEEAAEAEQVPAWKMEDALVKRLIVMNCDAGVFEVLRNQGTAFQMWDALRTRYYRVTSIEVCLITRELYTLKQGERGISEHLRRFEALANEIAEHGEPIAEAEKVLLFLMTLHPRFGVAAAAFQNADEDQLRWKDIASKFLQFETFHSDLVRSDHGGRAKIKSTKKFCKRCEKHGHVEKNCWRKNSRAHLG